jgi:hypothetical protein
MFKIHLVFESQTLMALRPGTAKYPRATASSDSRFADWATSDLGLHVLSIERDSTMAKFVTALTAMTFALGAAAYAGTPATVKTPAASANSPAPQPTSLSYSSTSSPFVDAANPNLPGATGRTIVPGDNSTIAGDAMATQMERTGAN